MLLRMLVHKYYCLCDALILTEKNPFYFGEFFIGFLDILISDPGKVMCFKD